MKALIARIFGRSQARALNPNAKALGALLPKESVARLLKECPDSRLFIQLAARESRKSEREVLSLAAQAHGIPVAFDVRPCSLLELRARVSLSELRACAVMPVVSRGEITGAIVADPALAAPVLKALSISSWYLGSWFDIARALDETEELLRSEEKEREQREKSTRVERARAILSSICTEARTHGALSVLLEVDGKECSYSFRTEGGAIARGAIGRKVWGDVLQACRMYAGGPTPFPEKGIALEEHASGQYQLVWETPAQARTQDAPSSASIPISTAGMASNVVPFPERGSREGGLVLVVEDSAAFGGVVCRFLERRGMRALRCVDGQEALEMLTIGRVRPQVIICDVHMPRMGGEEFVQKAHLVFQESEAPAIVAVSSDVEVETELALIAAGADLFLSKAADPRVLCAYVERLVGQGVRASGRKQA